MFLFPHTSFSYLSSFLLIIPLPFSLSFYLTDSNPLLAFNNQVREGHLYTGIYNTFHLVTDLMQYGNIGEIMLLLNTLNSSLC